MEAVCFHSLRQLLVACTVGVALNGTAQPRPHGCAEKNGTAGDGDDNNDLRSNKTNNENAALEKIIVQSASRQYNESASHRSREAGRRWRRRE